MIELVISGGQTGADQAAELAAQNSGILVSGWVPCRFMTETGPSRLLGTEQRELERDDWAHRSLADQYRERTLRNLGIAADDAGFAVVFDADPKVSNRTKLVIKDNGSRASSLVAAKYTLVIVRLRESNSTPRGFVLLDRHMQPSWLAGQIVNAKTETLFVGGNRESRFPGIGAWTKAYIGEVFRILKEAAQ